MLHNSRRLRIGIAVIIVALVVAAIAVFVIMPDYSSLQLPVAASWTSSNPVDGEEQREMQRCLQFTKHNSSSKEITTTLRAALQIYGTFRNSARHMYRFLRLIGYFDLDKITYDTFFLHDNSPSNRDSSSLASIKSLLSVQHIAYFGSVQSLFCPSESSFTVDTSDDIKRKERLRKQEEAVCRGYWANVEAARKSSVKFKSLYADSFVCRLYFRRFVVNMIRNEHQRKFSVEYDFVVRTRPDVAVMPFDVPVLKPISRLFSLGNNKSKTKLFFLASFDILTVAPPSLADLEASIISEDFPPLWAAVRDNDARLRNHSRFGDAEFQKTWLAMPEGNMEWFLFSRGVWPVVIDAASVIPSPLSIGIDTRYRRGGYPKLTGSVSFYTESALEQAARIIFSYSKKKNGDGDDSAVVAAQKRICEFTKRLSSDGVPSSEIGNDDADTQKQQPQHWFFSKLGHLGAALSHKPFIQALDPLPFSEASSNAAWNALVAPCGSTSNRINSNIKEQHEASSVSFHDQLSAFSRRASSLLLERHFALESFNHHHAVVLLDATPARSMKLGLGRLLVAHYESNLHVPFTRVDAFFLTKADSSSSMMISTRELEAHYFTNATGTGRRSTSTTTVVRPYIVSSATTTGDNIPSRIHSVVTQELDQRDYVAVLLVAECADLTSWTTALGSDVLQLLKDAATMKVDAIYLRLCVSNVGASSSFGDVFETLQKLRRSGVRVVLI